MTPSERKIFVNLVRQYIKKHNKFSEIKNLAKDDPVLNLFISQVPQKIILSVLLVDFEERLLEKNRAKTIIELGSVYKENKRMWNDYFILNCTRDIKNPQFKQLGNKVYKQLREIEEKVIWNMETGKYKEFSSSLSERYWMIVQEFFPYYQLSEVTTR